MRQIFFLFCFSFFSYQLISQPTYNWSRQFDQTSNSYFLNNCRVYAMAVNQTDGSVYAVGSVRGTVDFNPSAVGGDITAFGTSEDPFIVKYDASGNFQWVNRISNITGYGDGSNDRAISVAVDNSGNAYVTGDMYDGGLSGFLARYTSAGANTYTLQIEGYSSSNNTNGVAVDNSGNVYVFDRFDGTKDLNPGAGVDNHTAAGGYDMYIAKFTGSTGVYQWGKRIGGANYERCQQILCDGTYLYIAGGYSGTVDFNPDGGINNLTSPSGSYDAGFIARYSASTGAYDYAYSFGDPGGITITRDIALDGTDLYAIFQYTGAVDFQPGAGSLVLTPPTTTGGGMVKYDKNTMVASWGYETNLAINDGSYLDATTGMAAVISGYSGTQDLNPTAGTFNLTAGTLGGTTKAVICMTSAGTFNWAVNVSENTSVAYWNDIAFYGTSGFYSSGDFSSSVSLDPSNTTITLSEGTYGDDAFLAHYALCQSGTNTTSTTTICENATKTLTYTGAFTGTWTIISGGGSILGNIYTPANISVPTSVTIRYTDGCGTNTDVTFTVDPIYTPSITSSNANLCNGSSRTLTATPAGGTWSIISGGANASLAGNSLTGTNTGSVTIRYRITNACGNHDATQIINIVSPLSPSITSSSSDICINTNRTLTGTPAGGTWTINSGVGTIVGNTFSTATAGTTQIRYAVTNACGTYYAYQTINSVDTLSPSITSSVADLCNGSSRALTAIPSGGTWIIVNGGGNATIVGNTLTATNAGQVKVAYRVVNACGSIDDTVSISIVNPLTPNITSSGADLCNGSSVSLTGTPVGGTWAITSGGANASLIGNTLTGTTAGSVTIRYRVINACGTYDATQTISIVDPLSPVITSSSSDMCVGDTRSLTGTPIGGTWSITAGGAFGNISGGNQLNATSTGPITVEYSVSNSCGTYTITQSINVVSTVTPGITSSLADMCVGDKRELTASPGGGNWSILSGPGVIGVNDTLTATAAGTIQIRYSVTSGCGTGADTVNIMVNPVPTPVITSSNSTLCVGDSRALTGAPGGGIWGLLSGPGSLVGSTLTANANGTISIEYSVTTSGCTGTTNQNISVLDSSNATWTSPGVICENAGLTNLNGYLAPFATSGGTWSGHASVSSVGILNPSGLAGSTLNIKYKVGSSSCADSLTLSINILNTVDPTWNNPGTICENAGLTDLNTYLAGGATPGGVWSGHPSVTSGGIFNPSGLGGTSITIKYKVGTSPCADSLTLTFNVNNASDASWTNPVNVCDNSAIMDLNTLVTGNAGGTWSGTNVTVGGLFNPSGLNGPVTIRYMVGSSPCADTISHVVTVNIAPDASWSMPTTICASQLFDLDTMLLPSATNGGIWSGPGVTGSIFDPFGLIAPVTIKYIVGTLGCADSLSITITTIASSPNTPIVTLTVDTTCSGDTTTILASGSGSPVQYNIWTALVGGTFIGTAPLTVNPTITTTYYVEAIAPNLCLSYGGRQPIQVVVNPLPNANSGVDENICFGDSVTLIATGGGTYLWNNGVTNASNKVGPIITTNYIVTVTSVDGCIDTDTVIVNVQTTGIANAINDFYALTTGSQETINVITNDVGGSSTVSIVTAPLYGTATVGVGGTIIYTSALGYVGMDSLYYRICDPSCVLLCDTAKLLIEVQNDLTIPTGVSPNNDGKNDYFNILGLQKYPDNQIYIYNRWGDLIFQSKPYNNDWNGQTQHSLAGKEVVSGTYFYILELGPNLPTHKGYVELKK